VSEGDIDRLPDPSAFRDAMFLHVSGTWTARSLDEADALTLALVRRFRTPVTRSY